MYKLRVLPTILICFFIMLLMAAAACSGGTTTTASNPSTSASGPSTSTSNPSTSASQPATFQTLAESGQTVYSRSCAICHGTTGQGGSGPALWGSGANLGNFNGSSLFNKNAQDMLNFISSKMPLTAPGSLSHGQYLNVLGYILVQGNQVAGSTPFNESQLSSITLK